MVQFDPAKIDAIFADVDHCHIPGAAVGIAINGKPVYRKGFGLARLELPVVLSPSMRMRIGSTTKHFAAFTYMLLCEEGKAGIDDPVGKYFPELNPVTHSVTMRQLMGNTACLRDVYDVCHQFSGLAPAASSAALVALYRDMDDANAAPGSSWIYNNGNWAMLSVAIERITGQTLEEVMWQRIFEPLGMYDTLLRRWDHDFVSNCATPHMTVKPGLFEKWYWMDFAGAGAMVSTVDDMLRWLAHMDRPVVGNAATWALMTAPHTLANGTITNYGHGLVLGHYRGAKIIYHSGGWVGANAQMLKVPAAGLDVIVIVNRHDVSSIHLAQQILDTCLPELGPPEEPSAGPFATGVFHSPKTGRIIQLLAKEGQQVASIGGLDFPVGRDEQGVLRPATTMEFIKQAITLVGDRERPTALRFNYFGSQDELLPAKPADQSRAGAVVGQYRSETTGTDAVVAETNEGLRLRTQGKFGSMDYSLECLADRVYRARSPRAVIPPGGVLVFDADGNGFRYSTWQTWALPFRRRS